MDKLLDFPSSDTRLITEAPPYGNLRSQTSLDAASMKTIIHQILQAVTYLHSHSVYHLNLKSEQVLIYFKKPVLVKLEGFNCAGTDLSICSRAKHPDMAPELLGEGPSDQKSVDVSRCTRAVNVWSIGMIILKFSIIGPWCQKISSKNLKKQISRPGWNFLTNLANLMLQTEAHQRLSADSFLEKSSHLISDLEPISLGEQCLINFEFLQNYYKEKKFKQESMLKWVNVDVHRKPVTGINVRGICEIFEISPEKLRLLCHDLMHGNLAYYHETQEVCTSLSDMCTWLENHTKNAASITDAIELSDLEQEIKTIHFGSYSSNFLIP